MAFQFTSLPPANDTSFTRPNTVVAIVRKRGRCDSDQQGRPEKMYKGYEDTNTDTEMEGLPSSSLASSSTSSAGALVVSELDSQCPWKQDEEFYMEDGSCVLLVGDILFNVCDQISFMIYLETEFCFYEVHRSVLSKDSSSFKTMFSLPQGGLVTEGQSDEKPIILAGDTPDEFRHFLWALYALFVRL